MTRLFIVVAAVTLMAWTAVGAIRTVPRWHAVEDMDMRDDWGHYDAIATAVAHGDLSGGMETAHGTAIYGHFLGVLRVILGPGTFPLYFVHHVLLGGAVVILGYVAAGLWGFPAGIATLVIGNIWAGVDVTRWYSMRLLSENLVVPAIALAWLAMASVIRHPTVVRAGLAGVALGVAALARYTCLLFVLAAVVILARHLTGRPRWALAVTATIVVLPALVHIATAGRTAYLTSDASWHWWWRNAQFLFGGRLSAIHQEFRFRPHWPIMWALALVWFARAPKTSVVTQLLAAQLALTAVTLLLLPNAFIGVYGYRYTIPVFFPMILSIGALTPWIVRYLPAARAHPA